MSIEVMYPGFRDIVVEDFFEIMNTDPSSTGSDGLNMVANLACDLFYQIRENLENAVSENGVEETILEFSNHIKEILYERLLNKKPE